MRRIVSVPLFRRLPLSIPVLCGLAAMLTLAATDADAGRFDRRLKHHERQVAAWTSATTLSAMQLRRVLTGLARYPEPVREALLEAARRAAAGDMAAITNTVTTALPATLRPATTTVDLLNAFPELTVELGRVASRWPDDVRAWLRADAAWRERIDRRARKVWIRLLRQNPNALHQLIDVSRAFQEDFAHARREWEALHAAADATRRKLAEKKRQSARAPQRQLVVVSESHAWLYTQPPTLLDRGWGDPYNTWVYGYEPAPLWKSLAQRRDPLATGIEALEDRAVTVWNVPSYRVVRYILSRTTLYPDLADALLRLQEAGAAPETVAGAIAAWKAALSLRYPDAERLLSPDGERIARLRSLPAIAPGIDVPCVDDSCTASRLLTPSPSLAPAPEIRAPDVDQVALERIRQARVIHAALWASVALERGH